MDRPCPCPGPSLIDRVPRSARRHADRYRPTRHRGVGRPRQPRFAPARAGRLPRCNRRRDRRSRPARRVGRRSRACRGDLRRSGCSASYPNAAPGQAKAPYRIAPARCAIACSAAGLRRNSGSARSRPRIIWTIRPRRFLMRAARGAGTAGLSGIRAGVRLDGVPVPVIRPLLGWRRSELAGDRRGRRDRAFGRRSRRITTPRHDRTAFRALLAGNGSAPASRASRDRPRISPRPRRRSTGPLSVKRRCGADRLSGNESVRLCRSRGLAPRTAPPPAGPRSRPRRSHHRRAATRWIACSGCSIPGEPATLGGCRRPPRCGTGIVQPGATSPRRGGFLFRGGIGAFHCH